MEAERIDLSQCRLGELEPLQVLFGTPLLQEAIQRMTQFAPYTGAYFQFRFNWIAAQVGDEGTGSLDKMIPFPKQHGDTDHQRQDGDWWCNEDASECNDARSNDDS